METNDNLLRCTCGGALRERERLSLRQVFSARCERCGAAHIVPFTVAQACVCERLFVPQDSSDLACDFSCARNLPMREQRRRWLRSTIDNPVLLSGGRA